MIRQWKLTDRDSSIFTAMKTAAMLMVLIIHADLRSHGAPQTVVTDFYNEFFSMIMATAAVPVFFFISGFFMFRNFNFKIKFKSRIKTVYIPYFIWCTWGLFILIMLQGVLGSESLFSGKDLKLLRNFTTIDYLRVFWDIRDGEPITSTLWFLKDLCILIVLSPLLNFVVKSHSGGDFVLVMYMLGLAGVNNSLISFFSVFYFSAGGWIAYKGIDLFHKFDTHRMKIFTAAIVVMLFTSIAYLWNFEYYDKIKTIWVVLCLPLLYYLCSIKKIYKSPIMMRLAEYSFFIYLFHEPIMGYLQKLCFKFVHLPVYYQLVLYWIFPLMILTISIIVFKALKYMVPSILNILVGGRV